MRLDDLARAFHQRFADMSGSLEERAGRALADVLSETEGGLEGARNLFRMLFSEPELASSWRRVIIASEEGLAGVVRGVVTPAHVEQSHVVAALIILGQRFALDHWVKTDTTVPLALLIEDSVRSVLRTTDW